jgi:hypothetical protein
VAFSSGELDPLLHRRFDYQRFQTGLAKCNGFLPLQQGGFTRAPGTLYRGRTKNDALCVLVPFQFAANDALILEFTPNLMRVWRYGSLVMAGGVPYELVTPYGATSLSSLRWVQSADVTYMVDGLQPMQRLARFALDNWTIATAVLNAGPFRVQNLEKDITIQASANSGLISLTASTSFFTPQHVGGLLKLEPTDNTSVALWSTNEAISPGVQRRYNGNVYEVTAGTNSKTNPPFHSEGEALYDNEPLKWLFISSDIGIVRIVSVINGLSATAQVLQFVPSACVTVPTYRFSEGAWSEKYGWPTALEIFDQRLAVAGSAAEPRTVWFSLVGDFADFNSGTDADDAFAYTISGGASINKVLHLRRGATGLHIFALGEEYSTRSDSRAQVIGPTTAVFSADSEYGASAAIPIAPDGKPIFITRDRRRVIQIAYDFQADGNQARALSLPSQHLGAAFFEQIVWQNSPNRIAWLRRGTGDLVAMIHDPSEEILGWATVSVAGGYVDALAISPNAEGTNDVLTMAVVREIDGQSVRMIEEQALVYGVLNGAQPISESVHYFAASKFVLSEAATEFSVPHLAGLPDVYAWTDEGQFGPLAVDEAGLLTMPTSAKRAVIGLFDTSHAVETLDIQAATQNGNAMGRQKRIHSVGFALHRTAQGMIQVIERDFAQPDRVGKAQAMVPNSVASDLTRAFSGVMKLGLPSGHAKELAFLITPVGGAPLTVTAIIPDVQEAGS